MVAKNLIFVRETLLFIPNASEQEWISNATEIIGNNVSSSTENESYENRSVVANSQTVHSSSLLHYR